MPVIAGRGRGGGRASGRASRALAAAALLLASAAGDALAQTAPGGRRLEELTLEELMNVEVTTVAGRPRSRFASPAAVFVITAEDIRRSGHRTIAEALRLAPGMFVGRTGASDWTIGPRGLSGAGLTSTRMLVLVDGRIAYDPLFNGTLWDVVDVVLDDIDRIEVIRGPGATLWGVNAMNGVVNIITKSAHETEGNLARAGGGDLERAFATVRHGASFGDGGAYRVWAKYADHDSLELAGGDQAEWTRARGGFRIDAGDLAGTTWTLLGDAYSHPKTEIATRLPVPGRHQEFVDEVTDDDVAGGYLLFRAQRGSGADAGWSVQGYYDRTDRETSRIDLARDTVDLDFRSWRAVGGRHELVWGAQLNATEDRLDNGPSLVFEPTDRSWTTANAFAQVTTRLVPDRLFALVGTKVTHHDFVGWEVQPTARLWWTPNDRQTVWAAVSRPVRVPSRLERDGLLVFSYVDTGLAAGGPPSGVVVPVGLGGDPDLPAEELIAWELGHRLRLGDDWELDGALFYHDYRTLISVPATVAGTWNDLGSGVTWGADVALSRRMTGRWRLAGSYSYLEVEIDGPVFQFEEESVPEHLAQLRSSWDLREDFELHGALYYADRLPRLDIDAYERLDVGLTWRPSPRLEVALWGQNLLESAHAEASAAAIPRSAYGQLKVRF